MSESNYIHFDEVELRAVLAAILLSGHRQPQDADEALKFAHEAIAYARIIIREAGQLKDL